MGKIKYPIGILFTIVIGILLTMWLCCGTCYTGDCDSKEKTNTAVTTDQVTSTKTETPTKGDHFNGITLYDDNQELIERSNDNLDFKSSD